MRFCFLPQALLELTPPDTICLSLKLGINQRNKLLNSRKSSKTECRISLIKAQSKYWQHQHFCFLVSFLAPPLAACRQRVSSHRDAAQGVPFGHLCHLVRPWKLGSVHGGSAACRLSSLSGMFISASRLSMSSNGVQDISCWSL